MFCIGPTGDCGSVFHICMGDMLYVTRRSLCNVWVYENVVMLTFVLLLEMAACRVRLYYCSTYPSTIMIGVVGSPQRQYRIHSVTSQIEL